jgi:BolA protein
MSTTQEIVEAKLRDKLEPQHLEVINESHMHSVAAGSETHFKVVVVSSLFEGMSPVKRHQLVYGALADELGKKPAQGGIHALAITSRTPGEWAASPETNLSPLCASKGR